MTLFLASMYAPVGSIPKVLQPCFLNRVNNVPSLHPTSKTTLPLISEKYFLNLKLNLSCLQPHLLCLKTCNDKILEIEFFFDIVFLKSC